MNSAKMIYTNILSYARGDVTGDGIPDNVYLTGTKTPDSPFVQNITLVVKSGREGIITEVQLRENAGYSPTLFLGDFTGDGVRDILVSIATGGSGGTYYHYIYSFVNNVPRLILDGDMFNEQYKYSVNYMDNYKVEVISIKNNQRYIIDISYKGDQYLNEIYDSNGRLKAPISGFVNPISGLYPVDFDYNGVYELLIFQKVAGRYNADAIGYIQNILIWENNMFTLRNQFVAIFGGQL